MTPLPPPLQWRYVHAATGREVTKLSDLPDVRTFDPGGVADLLGFGHPLGTRTILAGVQGRCPAWDLAAPEPHPDQLGGAAQRRERLWQLLRGAVRRAAREFDRPRITLSGGLDSRAIAAAAAAEGLAVDCATFGDPDCADIPAATEIARRLGLPHTVTQLPPDAGLRHEERCWRATGGLGGAAAAPGAHTDAAWAQECDGILSGMSGEAVWGDLGAPGPSPPSRMSRLGVAEPPLEPSAVAPAPPQWLPPTSAGAWINLHTRQARGTANGIRSRLQLTPLVPVPWSPDLLAFCLALPPEDRRDRTLLRQMLDHFAEDVGPTALPAVRGPVHDLDRAMHTVAEWRRTLAQMTDRNCNGAFERLGLRPRAVRRIVRQVAGGSRRRAVFVSRLRVLWRWTRR
jgi:hypothetical protein